METISKPDYLSIMIVAGEASGDAHGAALVKAIREQAPFDVHFFGAAGENLRAAGVETIVRADDLAIMGLAEIARAVPMFWGVLRCLVSAARDRRPDLVILVDFPDFNLRLAAALKRRGFKIVYYVSPQIWAWRGYRIRQIRRNVDLMLSILPFEKKWYAERGYEKIEFVGNPLAASIAPGVGREEFCRAHALDPTRPIVSLLAGSRRKEVAKILPEMLRAVQKVHESRPDVQFVVAVAPTRTKEASQNIIDSAGKLPSLLVVKDETRAAVGISDAAIVASGTATLETALLGTPLAVVYKVSAQNWHLFRHFIKVPHFGLVNLIAGERLAAELIQNDCSGDKIGAEILRLLDRQVNESMRARLRDVAGRLGDSDASETAARLVLNQLAAG
jgi:lipid-A-disaccharide synthase